jgi:2',3'-cyclic-nucleotide 2'-phosphodiesterase
MKILFFGDIVGSIGRSAVVKALPSLKDKYSPDLIIANVENLAHGAGVTVKTLNELVDAGVDAFTGGNHSWDNPLGTPIFDDPEWKDRIVVPTNHGGAKNGSPSMVIEKNGAQIQVLNIMGQLFTHPDTTSPFETLDRLLTINDKRLTTLVDFHAEATAEKECFGHYADGKVAAVFGTHTHVPTADAKILPGGTAYVTDVGRCGAFDSVIGFEKTSVIKRFLAGGTGTFDLPKTGQAEVNAIVVTVDLDTGKATGLDRIREIVDV